MSAPIVEAPGNPYRGLPLLPIAERQARFDRDIATWRSRGVASVDSSTTVVVLEASDWDSDRLGLACGFLRIASLAGGPSDVDDGAVADAIERSGLALIRARVPSDDHEARRLARAAAMHQSGVLRSMWWDADRMPEPSAAVRLASPDDEDRIRRIAHDGYTNALLGLAGLDPESVRALYAEWAANDLHGRTDAVFVSPGTDGDVLGFLALDYERTPGAGAFVDLVVVDPAARRRGIGRDLMLAALDAAVARGATGVALGVHDDSRAAMALYTSLGFREALASVELVRVAAP